MKYKEHSLDPQAFLRAESPSPGSDVLRDGQGRGEPRSGADGVFDSWPPVT